MIVVTISHNDLIDMLEDKLGGIFEYIDEKDKVEAVQITRTAIMITIGKDSR